MVFRFKKLGLRKIIGLLGLLTLIMLIGIAIYAGYLNMKVNAAIAHISSQGSDNLVDNISTDAEEVMNQASQVEKTDELQPFTMLLTGIDYRKGSGGSMNTDVMMLITINPNSGESTLVSIPRDLEIRAEELGSHKANYYYAYYNNRDPKTALMQTKQLYSQYFMVPIDYMAVINFDGFRQIIDELGGLKINVDMDMKYVDKEDGTHIDLDKGLQQLNGKQTLDYLRYRKSNQGTKESSDPERNKRQQVVINELLVKISSLEGLMGLGRVVDVVGEAVKTDMPEQTIKKLMMSLGKVIPDSIETIQLEGQWKNPYLEVNEEEIQAAMSALRLRRETKIDRSPSSF